ncbi:Flp family type IVb pilin [Clavibacter sp. Sh2141]|uniref:Flp family type IVb pilin n=1 Tax=Clavibacter sp. Sh2141 TaxID=3395374 RepID=UPI0039BD4B06
MLSLLVSLQSLLVTTKDRLSREEEGATAVEYGLIIGLIAVVIIGVVALLGPQLAAMFQGVSDKLPDAPAVSPTAG